MKENKSFEERTESFFNTTANLACGSLIALLLLLAAIFIIIVIVAVISGSPE